MDPTPLTESASQLEHGTALIVVAMTFLIGIIASLLPVLPGTLIVWIGILIYKLWLPQMLSWWFVIITGLLMVLAQVLDLVCSYYGAKRFGATWRGAVGALAGTIIGPIVFSAIPGFGTLLGFIVGPVIGAVIGELCGGRSLKDGGKAGFGSVVGGVISFGLKLGIAFAMIIWFAIEVWRGGG